MFKFRLQRVLELREKREQAVASRLAAARSQEERLREEAARLEGARDEGVQRAATLQGATPTVGQLQNLRYVVERLNVEIEQAHRVADAAGQKVEHCLTEFAAAVRDRKVLDRLKDRDRESWIAGEAHADRQVMDGVALTGFVRSKAARQEPEA